jgi:superfamily II DNA or RNA helicase
MTYKKGSMLTAFHARYYALDLSRRGLAGEVDAVGTALFDAQVDLNPHQIEAALVGMQASAEQGRLLADEVGLGKTIEAALVLCQRWAERRRRLLVICPAALRKQWAQELEEKLGLPVAIVDARRPEGNPFDQRAVVVCSYQYAARRAAALTAISWDLVVVDEAHRLRNAWKSESRLGRPLLEALGAVPKLLLTATPLQNSLLELYGIVSVIDQKTFGDAAAFRSRFMKGTPDYEELKRRLSSVCQRTLRRAVLPYIRFTERRSLTWKFTSSPIERHLYDAVSDFLARDDLTSLPVQQRGLITMVLRKLLASSSHAIAGGLSTLRARLEDAAHAAEHDPGDDFSDEGFDDGWLDDPADELPLNDGEPAKWTLADEIAEIDRLIGMAHGVQTDRKALALLDALSAGFSEIRTLGAAEKAVVFTESRRTQDWLRHWLERHGYAGRIVCFNGSNDDADARAILAAWERRHSDAKAASRTASMRAALVEHFRDSGTLLIATEAGAEGLNLQFCSLVVNYDLPWNPQRVEQRIGRCHRYGQKHDVVVVNFLDDGNAADARVLELLTDKCQIFDGVFGASDEVLGAIEGGVGLEVKIHRIFRTCRTPDAIEAAFAALRQEMDDTIKQREAHARKALLDHFDAEVHDKLKVRLDEARLRLDRIGRQFWSLTRWALSDVATFDPERYRFRLLRAPLPSVPTGEYELVSREAQGVAEAFVYRVSHPLGEHVVHTGLAAETPLARVTFDVSHHPLKVTIVEALRGRSGWLTLERLRITGLAEEEHLLLSGVDDEGRDLDAETLDRLMTVDASAVRAVDACPAMDRLTTAAERMRGAVVAQAADRNQAEFRQARERLERWADDQIRGAEAAITEIRHELRALERRARQAETLQEHREVQEQVTQAEDRQRRARVRVFNIEDEVRARRNQLLDELDKRVAQRSVAETVFRIAWTVE